jgi:hypothetical protein
MIVGAIAITGLIVRNHSERPIAATFTGLASVIGVATTGNPQFFAEAKGYAG